MNNPIDPKLVKRIDQANRGMLYGLVVAVIAIIIGMVIIISMLVVIQQTQDKSLDVSRSMAAENHRRTQEYVKCVAVAVTLPLRERNPNAVESCANRAAETTKEADRYGK